MTYLATVAGTLFVFLGLTLGWGLPVARRLPLPVTLRFVIAPFAGLLGIHLIATGAYLWWHGVHWALPVLILTAAVGWLESYREIAAWGRSRAVRSLAGLWLFATVVALLLLGVIRNYSGGDWIGDWAGHHHRAGYFLDPTGDWDWMFAKDPLTGRPPLQNLVTAAFLTVGNLDFAAYQIFTTLLGSLCVLPLGALVSGRAPDDEAPPALRARRRAWLGALLVCSPLVMQNLTYPWTKMGTNAWVLLAVLLGWSIRWLPQKRGFLTVLAAVAMGAAVITHYSAAVYLVVLGPTYWVWTRRHDDRRLSGRTWTTAGVAGALVLATWFGWAAATRGADALVRSTTTSQYLEQTESVGGGLAAFGENVARTLVPHPLLPRPAVDPPATDPWARWRDFWFQLFQTNLPFAVGSVTLVMLAWARGGPLRGAIALPVAAIVLLGIAVHPAVSHWGLVHICLQPLVLFALAWTATRLADRGRPVLRWALPLLGLEAALGIGLQVAVESITVPPQVLAWQDGAPLAAVYGQALRANAGAKQAFMYQFLGDTAPAPAAVIGGLAAAVVLWWGWRLVKRS